MPKLKYLLKLFFEHGLIFFFFVETTWPKFFLIKT